MAYIRTKKESQPLLVEDEKTTLAIKLLSLKDKEIVHAIHVVYEDLTSITTKTSKAEYNKEIDAALKRVKGGKFVSHEDVMNEMNDW
jgi:hypothetical protein